MMTRRRAVADTRTGGSQGGRVRVGATLLALFVGGLAVLAWQIYSAVGRTPQELFDYLDQRLIGHSHLDVVAKPFLAHARQAFAAQPAAERMTAPFQVPRLSPLVLVPEGVAVGVGAQASGNAHGRVLRVGPLEDVRTIAEAAKKARDGDVIEIARGEYVGDVAVWHQKN